MRAHAGEATGNFVKATMLVPKTAPQSPRQAAPSQPPQPSPRSPGGRPNHPHYRGPGVRPHGHFRPFANPAPFFAPVPLFVPPPTYYEYYGATPYLAPPPVYYDYGYDAAPPPYGPPAYVERDDGYRYYCSARAAYYPEIVECPEPWLVVPPQ